MSVEYMDNTYLFYFPVNNREQEKELATFETKIARVAGGFTTHYPARGGWVDRATGEIIRDDLAIVEASGSFGVSEQMIMEGLFKGAGKKMGEQAVYLSLDGKAKLVNLN